MSSPAPALAHSEQHPPLFPVSFLFQTSKQQSPSVNVAIPYLYARSLFVVPLTQTHASHRPIQRVYER